MNHIPDLVLIYISVINLMSFLIMGIDKKRAEQQKRRISEKTLLTFSVIGGAIGILSGMVIWKHKLSKSKFTMGVPLNICLHWLLINFAYLIFYP